MLRHEAIVLKVMVDNLYFRLVELIYRYTKASRQVWLEPCTMCVCISVYWGAHVIEFHFVYQPSDVQRTPSVPSQVEPVPVLGASERTWNVPSKPRPQARSIPVHKW